MNHKVFARSGIQECVGGIKDISFRKTFSESSPRKGILFLTPDSDCTL